MLKVFMDDNNFLHHYQTKEESNQKLNTITQNLRGLFEQSNWKAEHTEKLKEKVRNKMHRIRPQIERTHLNALRDDLQPFKEAFEKLPSHIHEEAFRAFVFHIGKDKAKNWFLALVKAND